MIAYNSDLYENFTQALFQPRGLLAIGLIVDVILGIFYLNYVSYKDWRQNEFRAEKIEQCGNEYKAQKLVIT